MDDWAKQRLAELEARAPVKRRAAKAKKYANVPLTDDWGYRAMTVAGRGAAIVVHALYVQGSTGRGDVPITPAVLRRCGIGRKQRFKTIDRLVKEGLATVRYRGKLRGSSPLLTMLMPEAGSERSKTEH
jgi:hypothetical protein